MSKPFDATTKELIEKDPKAWLELLLGRRLDTVRVLNVDLATITTEADSVFLVEGPTPWIVHVELQSGSDPTVPVRLQRYNILIHYREALPVQSIALLLRQEADGPAMAGLLQQRLPDGSLYHEFRYNVVRIWERSVEEILAGGLANLPLAPIANVAPADLPEVIRRMEQRIDGEATQAEAAELWLAVFLPTGLIYPKDFIKPLLQGIRAMKESSAYQLILEEGFAQGEMREATKLLKKLGTREFGTPDHSVSAAIEAITDLDRIELLLERLREASGWEELLARE